MQSGMFRSLSANIYYLYLIKLSKWLMLIMPIVVLFYADNGLGTYHIYLLQAAYSLAVAILEIPSGYMADVIGRRTSLIIGSILGTLGFVVLSLSHSFQGFLVAEIILGLGGSCISGSDSAVLYDSLAAKDREHYYLRYEGRITALGNLAETFAAVGGGLLAAWLSYRSVYGAQAIVAAVAIPASLLIIEPQREKLARPSLGQVLGISREALFVDKKLSATLLLSSVSGTATLCMAWTAQVYFVSVDFDEAQITPLWVILNLTVAVISAYAAVVIDRLGQRRAMLIIIFCLPLGYILLGALPVLPALGVLWIFYMIRGYATPMLRDMINQNCRSNVRATVLSIRSLLVRVGFAGAGPFIGWVALHGSLSTALTMFGFILGVLSLVAGSLALRQLSPANQIDQR
jgi:MFS family permease